MNQSRENGQKALFWRQKVEYFGHTLSRIGPCHFSSFSLTSCKKSEKSDSGKYENFCDRLTDRRTDEIWRTANSIEHNKHHNSNWTNKNVRSCLSARKSPHPLNLRTMIIFELEKCRECSRRRDVMRHWQGMWLHLNIVSIFTFMMFPRLHEPAVNQTTI